MKVVGDLQRAKGYSKWALGFNVAALVCIILITLGLIIGFSVMASHARRYQQDYYYNHNYHDNNRYGG